MMSGILLVILDRAIISLSRMYLISPLMLAIENSVILQKNTETYSHHDLQGSLFYIFLNLFESVL